MCYPPFPWNSIIFNPPPVWIFHIFVKPFRPTGRIRWYVLPIWLITSKYFKWLYFCISVQVASTKEVIRAYESRNSGIKNQKRLKFSPYRCSTNATYINFTLLQTGTYSTNKNTLCWMCVSSEDIITIKCIFICVIMICPFGFSSHTQSHEVQKLKWCFPSKDHLFCTKWTK